MQYYLTLALALFVYMNLWFVVSLIKKRNDVADVAWGMGFVLMAWMSVFISDSYSLKNLLVCLLVSVWGIRLSFHIYQRNKGKKEDYRYLAWRNDWGKYFYVFSYLKVYILQGVLLFIIVLPVLVINKSGFHDLGFLDLIGFLVWIFGFYFEAVGDLQLSKFIKDPNNKGKLMQSGLWSYTRHPNYFGEVTQWWGLWIMTLNVSNSWFSIIGPITITILILKVSGIPILEKKMEENPEFVEYKKRVSMFIPLPSRKD